MQLGVGEVIDDRYELLQVLGSGGFATVYRARQKQFDRLVAVKVLSKALADADGLARFELEAKALSLLKHPNVISIYAYGVWNGAPYMVTELLEGEDLEALLSAGPVEPRHALRLIRQLFAGLDSAHKAGILHRDLKPSNVIVTKERDTETIKLIDFGLAKLLPGYGTNYQKLTEIGLAVGTCHYMSPEQCLGEKVDERSDIYAGGCILYQCLTGRYPFEGEDGVEVMYHHLRDHPMRLTSQLGTTGELGLMRALQAILDNCMAKNPDDRYDDASAAIADIDALLSGKFGVVRALSGQPKALQLPESKESVRTRRIAFALAGTLVAFVTVTCLVVVKQAPGLVLGGPSAEQLCDALYPEIQHKSADDIGPYEERIVQCLKRAEADGSLDPRRCAYLHKKMAEYYLHQNDLESADKSAAAAWKLIETHHLDRRWRYAYDSVKLKALKRLQRWSDAEQLIAKNVSDPELRKNLTAYASWQEKYCVMLLNHRRYAEAAAIQSERAAAATTDSNRHGEEQELANILLANKQYKEAGEIFRKWIKADRDIETWRDYLGLARLSLAQGDKTSVAPLLAKATEMRADLPGMPDSLCLALLSLCEAVNQGNRKSVNEQLARLETGNFIADCDGFVIDMDHRLLKRYLQERGLAPELRKYKDMINQVHQQADANADKQVD